MLTPAMQGVILAIAKARQTFDKEGPEAGLIKVRRFEGRSGICVKSVRVTEVTASAPPGLPRGVLPPVRALPGGDHAPVGRPAAALPGLLLPEQSTQARHREDAAGAVHRPQPQLRREVDDGSAAPADVFCDSVCWVMDLLEVQRI